MARLLLVDDEPGVLFMLKEVLTERGHEPVTASSAKEALSRLEGVELVLTDLSMPGMDGLALLKAIREREEALPVILLTAHGSERIAVDAIRAGAYDYLTKPLDVDQLDLVVDRALEAHGLRVKTRRLAAEQAIGRRIVGDSAPMRRLVDAVARVAAKDVTVLVMGETGTGKELIGSMLHVQSKRANKPLVRFNCAAIPAELAESELFGHLRGAFTGAVATRRGFFSQADGGTLILDEVGELPLPIQAKLLRALQEGEIQPVGSSRVERVNVRIIAATNRDLAVEAKAGRFREDLYYRLNVVELRVPSLRERRDDIPPLVDEFIRRYAERFGVGVASASPGLLAKMQRSDWPGNVRQLENAVARMVALSNGGVLEAEAYEEEERLPAVQAPGMDVETPVGGLSLREQVEAFERGLIARALANAHGNQSEAARRLGASRPTLIDKIKKYRLNVEPEG